MRFNLPVTATEQTFAAPQWFIGATDINRHHNVGARVKKTAGNTNAAVTRGRPFESISSGLRALVERLNR